MLEGAEVERLMKIIAKTARKDRRAGRHHHNQTRRPRVLANATSAAQKNARGTMRRNISNNFPPNIHLREEQNRIRAHSYHA